MPSLRAIPSLAALGAVLACLTTPSVAQAQTPAQTRAKLPTQRDTVAETRLTPRDTFNLAWARDVMISPDGRTIAYVRVANDIMTDTSVPRLWLVDVASGHQTPITARDVATPVWSPDGTRLAYIAKAAGGTSQLFVWSRATGEAKAITSGDEAPGAPSWSPAGDRLAFIRLVPQAPLTAAPVAMPPGATWAPPLHIIDRPDFQADDVGLRPEGHAQIFVVAATGGDAQAITSGPFEYSGPVAWTPDGLGVIVSSNHDPDRALDFDGSDLYRVDLRSHVLTRLTSRIGSEAQPAVSPDGRLIAFTGAEDHGKAFGTQKLWLINSDGTGLRQLAANVDRDFDKPVWSADGRSMYVAYADKGDMLAAQVDLDGHVKVLTRALRSSSTDRPDTEGAFSVSLGGVLAYGGNTRPLPAEVMVTTGDHSRTLTALNQAVFAGKDLGTLQPITVVSPVDQRPIGAWMLRPPGYDPDRRFPTILEIHGGPNSAYGPNWSTIYALYAQAGYVVVFANPRGSSSYGEDFGNIIQYDFPNHDYDDLMAVVDKAIAMGVADPANLFVTGGSGGGLLTAWSVGKTNRFRAAMAQKPVIDWISEVYGTDRIFPLMAKYWFRKQAWEDPLSYWRHSPLSLAGQITTPTALMVGEDDLRTPRGEAQQMFTALSLRHVPTRLIRIPGASHESMASRPSQLISEVQATLDWFARFRVPDGAVTTPSGTVTNTAPLP